METEWTFTPYSRHVEVCVRIGPFFKKIHISNVEWQSWERPFSIMEGICRTLTRDVLQYALGHI